jgi:hypothetical protein
MLETYFGSPKMVAHLRAGLSGPYMDGFAGSLKRSGYEPSVAVCYLRAAAHIGLSRWGFAYVLKQHVEMAGQHCPGLLNKRVSPHVLRHTCAMIMLQATQDIRKVSLWLGHATLASTEIYTRGDPTEKLEAIEAIVPPHLRKGAFRPPNKLIALLRDTAVMESKTVHEQHQTEESRR